MNPFLLVHKGWKRWTHAIGFGELLQCISIYVSANLIKWETIELIERMGKKSPSTKTTQEPWLIENTGSLWRFSNYSERMENKEWQRGMECEKGSMRCSKDSEWIIVVKATNLNFSLPILYHRNVCDSYTVWVNVSLKLWIPEQNVLFKIPWIGKVAWTLQLHDVQYW